MLLRFVVENYKSFKSEAVLNLIPATSKIHPDHVISDKARGKSVEAVPLVVLYGANASGKSTLVQAMAAAQRIITQGTRGEETIPVQPFRLDKKLLDKPSRFEFTLKHEGVLYTYGFAVSATTVHEEWLFAVYKSKEARVFERVTKGGKAIVAIGASLASSKSEKQRLEFVAQGTRPNQLFLTEANERNVAGLRPIMDWFRSNLQIVLPESTLATLVPLVHSNRTFVQFLGEFLRTADTGIKTIGTSTDRVDIDGRFFDVPEDTRTAIRGSLSNGKSKSVLVRDGDDFLMLRLDADQKTVAISLRTQHTTRDGETVDFRIPEESDGTRRAMHLVPALLDLQANEKVYVIDELDRSMHPLLCRLYVETFLRGIRAAKSHGQMIVTTHETGILDLDLLRRDEIWFLEKDSEGGSRLTSLAEYDVRADLKIDKGYLNGRFGAIPFIGDVARLMPGKHTWA